MLREVDEEFKEGRGVRSKGSSREEWYALKISFRCCFRCKKLSDPCFMLRTVSLFVCDLDEARAGQQSVHQTQEKSLRNRTINTDPLSYPQCAPFSVSHTRTFRVQ